jgi:23S rRNA pseudouridine955/2504/2580 synthase
MPGVQLVTVDAEEGELRLDRWFQRHFPQLTHGRLEKMLRKGEVRVDGARVKAATRIGPGQTVRVPPLPDAAPTPPATRRRRNRPTPPVRPTPRRSAPPCSTRIAT